MNVPHFIKLCIKISCFIAVLPLLLPIAALFALTIPIIAIETTIKWAFSNQSLRDAIHNQLHVTTKPKS